MKSKAFYITIVGWGFLLASCLPPSNNPVDQSGGASVSITPYLGTWNLTEIAEEPTDPGLTLEVVNNSGTYEAKVTEEGEAATTDTFELAEVSNQIIVSLKRKEDDWDIFEAVLQDQGSVLMIRSMDMATVKEAIESEDLEGEIVSWTDREKVVRITASATDLRSYISGESDLFVDLWKFEKNP